MNKIIIVEWIKEESEYKKAMVVVYSTHSRFIVGSRFDYGFFNIATDEGFSIISYPLKDK